MIIDLDYLSGRTQGDLCVAHAAEVDLPRGFALDDRRRAAEPPLKISPVAVAETASVEVVEIEIEVDIEIEVLEDEDEVEVVEVDLDPEPEPEPEPAPVAEATAANDAEEGDLAQLLDARTPLLRRAFDNIQLD